MDAHSRAPLRSYNNNIPSREMEHSQGSKRPIDAIDLTLSDDESSFPKPKKVHVSTQDSGYQSLVSNSQGESSSQPIDLEDEANELVFGEDADSLEHFQKYGSLSTKIVGIRYYNGIASMGEYVVARR